MANEPLQFTDAAVRHLTKILDKNQASAFRLSIKVTGCSGYMYQPETVNEPKEGDIEIQTPQGLLVYLDPKAKDILQGTLVDFVEKSLGMKQLVFNNPNVDSTCGCGESFNLKENTDESE